MEHIPSDYVIGELFFIICLFVCLFNHFLYSSGRHLQQHKTAYTFLRRILKKGLEISKRTEREGSFMTGVWGRMWSEGA